MVLGTTAAVLAIVRDDDPEARGDLVAYSCKEPGNSWYAICVMTSDGTERRRLTRRLTTTDPAWSPDGRRIAFTRNEDVGESTTFTEDDVFVMNADGDDPRQLTVEQEGSSSSQPTWSPDGREIAFVRGQSVPTAVVAATALMFGDLLVMHADGSETRPLTRGGPDAAPAWSPDGREIAFVRGSDLNRPNGDMDLYVVDPVGGGLRRLTRTAGAFETAPAWSPDGSRIAFARAAEQAPYDGKAAIFIVNRDGTGERLLLEHRYFAYSSYGLSWSPDGRTIAFETSPTIECSAVHLLDIASGRVKPLTSCTRRRDSAVAPTWQPLAR